MYGQVYRNPLTGELRGVKEAIEARNEWRERQKKEEEGWRKNNPKIASLTNAERLKIAKDDTVRAWLLVRYSSFKDRMSFSEWLHSKK